MISYADRLGQLGISHVTLGESLRYIKINFRKMLLNILIVIKIVCKSKFRNSQISKRKNLYGQFD